ncbi:MAG TPA: aldo/keto reductase [Gaiellaceae bacterium]|nr:aldo/keto reductase [Gaiellaceae bacterium]
MERRALGGSGLEVTRLILGCGNFGGVGSAPELFGQGESREEAAAIMDAAWEAGITTFDTADAYGGGRSETSIGEWLRAKEPEVRERIQLSTKVYNPMDADADWGLRPRRIKRQLESSLERLGVEGVDMYLAHAPDATTPIELTLEAFDELVRAGKVRAVGASNYEGIELEEALEASARHGLVRYEWVQNSYSLLDRVSTEVTILPLCEEHGLGFTPFSPLAGGWLTGKYREGEPPPPGSRMTQRPEGYLHLDTHATYRGLEQLAEEAAARDVDAATLAIAWVLSNPQVTAVVVGPRRPEHLEAARRALDLDLAPDERDELAGLFDP